MLIEWVPILLSTKSCANHTSVIVDFSNQPILITTQSLKSLLSKSKSSRKSSLIMSKIWNSSLESRPSHATRVHNSAQWISKIWKHLWAQSPCDFEDTEQTDAAQHRDPDGRDHLHLHQHCLQNPTTNHEAIETIEERYEVDLKAEAVDLHQHLQCKQTQKDLICSFWNIKETVFKTGSVHVIPGKLWQHFTLLTHTHTHTHPVCRWATAVGRSVQRRWRLCWGTPAAAPASRNWWIWRPHGSSSW